MRKVKLAIIEGVGAGERVRISALPGKLITEVIAETKQLVWVTMKERHLGVIIGGVIDVLQVRGTGTAKKVAKGVTGLRNATKVDQIGRAHGARGWKAEVCN